MKDFAYLLAKSFFQKNILNCSLKDRCVQNRRYFIFI